MFFWLSSLERKDSVEAYGFYNSSNVLRIKCEGERQKYSKYIYVFRVFRFLSPTKLNRNELAGYSKAHSIQPLCLGGVGIHFVHLLWGFKGERLRLEPVQRYSYYEDIRKDSKESFFLLRIDIHNKQNH